MYTRIAMLLLCVALLPTAAHAATLSADPTVFELREGDTKTISLRVFADGSINTIGTALIVPEGLSFVSVTEGKVVTQWVEPPAYDSAAHEVVLSGIIAEGWRGRATLATVVLRAEQTGSYTLAFNPDKTELYKNDGKATPEPVTFGTTTRVNFEPWTLLFVLGVLFIMIVMKFLRVRIIFV